MFRPLTRTKQQLSTEECIRILKSEPRGVLSVLGDNDYPYALPINFFYDETQNKIYFHSGKTGHKMDAVSAHDKVSFCVYDKGYHKDGHWSLNISSVIVFGRIKLVKDWSWDMMRDFCKKFTQDTEYIEHEITQFANNTAVLELTIEHMCGKLVNES